MSSYVRKLLKSRQRRVADSGEPDAAARPAYEPPPSASCFNVRAGCVQAASHAARPA